MKRAGSLFGLVVCLHAGLLTAAFGQTETLFTDSGQELISLHGNLSTNVALADVDGDGDVDAVVVQGGESAANVIWLNNGSAQFTESANTVGSGDSAAVALGDFDGDGDPDAWIGNRDGDDEVWINQGGAQGGAVGAYGLGSSVATGTTSAVAVGDLDGDTDLDIVVSGSNPRVWWNDGSAAFPTSTVIDAPGQGDVALADLDADLDLDIVVAGEGQFFTSNQVLFNNGPGTQAFTPGPALAMDPLATGVAIADLDGDTRPDVFFATTGNNQIWWNAGDGTFSAGPLLGSENDADVALDDLDGDGDVDAFVARRTIGTTPQPDGVWLNNGNRTFTLSLQALGDSNSYAVALGDLNGDGGQDAFVAASGPNKVWLNTAGPPSVATLFVDSGQRLSDSAFRSVALGDVDGDGDADAVIGSSYYTRVWFNDPPPTLTENTGFIGHGGDDIALGDLDGDGDLDVFIGRSGSRIWVNQGGGQGGIAGQFADSGMVLGTRVTNAVALGDVDGDGDLDAVVTHVFDPSSLWLNQGGVQGGVEGQFVSSGQVLAIGERFGAGGVALGDLDGDGDLDAAFAVDGYPVWVNQGGSQAGTPGVFIQQTAGPTVGFARDAVALGDLDGDGDLDLVLEASPDMQVWQNQGGDQGGTEGAFAVTETLESSGGSLGVTLGDVDGDADLDIVTLGVGRADVWLNGDVGFTLRQSIRSRSASAYDLALGDLDGDGAPEIVFVGSGAGGNQVWLNRSADLVPVVMEIPWLTTNEAGERLFFWTELTNALVPVWLSRPTALPFFLETQFDRGGPDKFWNDRIDFVPGETERFLTAYSDEPKGADGTVYNPYLGLERITTPDVSYTVTVSDAPPEANRLIPDQFQVVFLNPDFGFRDCFLAGMQAMLRWLGASGAAPSSAPAQTPATDLDLVPFRALRDEVLAGSPQGRYYIDLYATRSAELLAILAANPALMLEVAQALNAWGPAIQALVDGQGGSVEISDELAAELLRLRDRVRTLAGDELRQVIDAETAALGLSTWVGLSMDDVLSRLVPTPPRLSDDAAAKRVVTCGRTTNKQGAKLATSKLKILHKCGLALTKCVQTKEDGEKRDDCLTKALGKCAQDLAKIAKAEDKLEAGVAKKCADVGIDHLRASDGLGYNGVAATCAADHASPLDDVAGVGACLMLHHECRTEEAAETLLPRLKELMRVAGVEQGVLDGLSCLTDFGGVGGDVDAPKDLGKDVERCIKETTKAGARYLAVLLKTHAKCLDAMFACVQRKSGEPKCRAKAATTCDKGTAGLLKAAAKLARSLEGKCGGIDFPMLAASDAANLAALANRCDAVGVTSLASLDDYRRCAERRLTCLGEEMTVLTSPRARELATFAGRAFGSPFCSE